MMDSRSISKVVLPALLAFGWAGCTHDNVITEPEPSKGYPEAITPDILIENFALAYSGRDLEGYAALLDEDFVFTFLPCDVTELGLKKDHYDRQDELASAERIFSGEPHVRDDGTVVPAIAAIEALDVRRLTEWVGAGDPDRPEIVSAAFHLRFRFVREEATDLVVDGPGIFFARPAADRRGADRYKMVGWIDRTRACAAD